MRRAEQTMDLGADVRPFNRLAYVLAAIATVVLITGFGLYARYGSSFVTKQDDRCSEVLAIKAQRLAAAGNTAEAKQMYREALGYFFPDKQLEVRTNQALARLYLADGQPSEAVRLLRKALDLAPANGDTFTLLVHGLVDMGQKENALKLTDIWYQTMKKNGSADGMKWAKYNEGRIYQSLNDHQKAADSFAASFSAVAWRDAAIAAARSYVRAGAPQEAAKYWTWLKENGSPEQRAQATRFLATRKVEGS